MIDLHTHTTNSDGTWSTIELLEKAEQKNIKILSITDHDGIGAYNDIENLNIKKIYSGRLVTGIEVNCVFDNTKIELLGYGFNKEPIKRWLDSLYGGNLKKNNMVKAFNELLKICKKNNIKISNELIYNPELEYPIDKIYYDIIKYKENMKFFDLEVWNSNPIFYRKCTTDKKFILYKDFSKDYPTAEEVSKVLHENGGKVFLAHLYVYGMDDYEGFLEKLYKTDILDGVECYYSKFSDKQTNYLEEFCNKNNLLKSGGSDCHGNKYKGINLGSGYGNLKVKEESINEWI